MNIFQDEINVATVNAINGMRDRITQLEEQVKSLTTQTAPVTELGFSGPVTTHTGTGRVVRAYQKAKRKAVDAFNQQAVYGTPNDTR